MFLRGPQTPGELRTRTNRLCEFQDVHETESVLIEMKTAEPSPFVIKLEREPGKRQSRYAHCFTDLETLEKDINAEAPVTSYTHHIDDSPSHNQTTRITALEEQVELMQLEIDELRQLILDKA